MKRPLLAVLLYFIAFPVPAAPLYAGLQVGDQSAGVLLGYRINNTFGIEAHYSRSSNTTLHAGLNVETTSIGKGLVATATIPMKLRDSVPYDLFFKFGLERTAYTEKYNLPTTVTLTLPYNDSIDYSKNQLVLGVGAEYDYSRNIAWRAGLDVVGKDRNFNVGAIFRF